jgi:hypothetical protein
MDENWLLLGDKASFYWWSCHTQQLSGPQFRPDLGQYYELHFLPTYKEGQFPSYMVTIGGSAYIVDGDKITKCQSIQHISDIERITVINNNRVAISRRTSLCIYDYVQDVLVASRQFGHFSFAFDHRICYNAHSHLLVRNTGILKAYNPENLGKVCKLPWGLGGLLIATGEHDYAYHSFRDMGFCSIDNNVITFISFGLDSKFEAISMNRIIMSNKEFNLVTCWNLSTQQFEWIKPSSVRPQVANTRYWVGTRGGEYQTAVIYDYGG